MGEAAHRNVLKPESVTDVLLAWTEGDAAALDRLMPRVYRALQKMASAYLHRERPGHTLDTSALVHEAYLKLVDQSRATWRNRAQFFGVVAQMMRRILVDHARRRKASVRGGLKVTLAQAVDDKAEGVVDILEVDRALRRLAAQDRRCARIVELRFFAGLTIDETAAVLEISPATVKREWRFSRTWLRRELSSGGSDGA